MYAYGYLSNLCCRFEVQDFVYKAKDNYNLLSWRLLDNFLHVTGNYQLQSFVYTYTNDVFVIIYWHGTDFQ